MSAGRTVREIHLVVDHVLAQQGLPCVAMTTSNPREAERMRKQLDRDYRGQLPGVHPQAIIASISTAVIDESAVS